MIVNIIKKYAVYLFVLLFTTGITSISYAQFSTKQPVKLTNLLNSFYPDFKIKDDKEPYPALVGTGLLTDKQFEIAYLNSLPDARPLGFKQLKSENTLDQPFYTKAEEYKAYKMGEWTWVSPSDAKNKMDFALVWIPKDENNHMPENMIPTDPNGFFMVVNPAALIGANSNSSKPLVNTKGQTIVKATTSNAENGQMITREQAAEREKDYTNAVNRLRELDKRFEPYAEMLMRDQRTVFLTRQWRGRAMSIVDAQISVVEGYLKKWEKYLAPSDLASWKYRLSQLNSMRYKI